MNLPLSGTKKISVWDWPVRIFHWLIVLLFIVSWSSAEIGGNAMQYHLWSGYTSLGLVLILALVAAAGVYALVTKL